MTANHQDQMKLALASAQIAYTPQYSITPTAQMSLENIDRDRWAFDRLIIDPKYEGWLRRRAFIRSGHHSLHLEGSRLTEEQVAGILESSRGEIDGLESQQETDVRNWDQAMRFVDSMSTNGDSPITPLLMRHIHQLMLGQNDRQNTPGEYRRGEARVRHPVSRKLVYRGPPAGDVPDLVQQFGNWLRDSASACHPVLAAGIAHLRFVEIHPFVDGNGRTTRALTTLMLQRQGYSFNRLLALEHYFDLDIVKYCDAIGGTVGDSFQEGRDLTSWLEYFTFALAVEVGLASDAVVDLRRKMEGWHTALSKKGYNERLRDILAYAVINQSIRPRDIVRIAGVSSVTASTDLKHLADAKLLEGVGSGRARVYRPTESFWEQL